MSPFLELWHHSIVQSCEDYHFEKWPKAYFQEIIDELPECFGSQNLTQNWRICGACNTLQGSSWHNLLLIFFSFLVKGHRGVIKQSLEGKKVCNSQSYVFLLSHFGMAIRKTTWTSLFFSVDLLVSPLLHCHKLNVILYNHLPYVQMWSWTWGLSSGTVSGRS